MARRSIDVDSFHHSNPIPCATRIGPLIVSSIIVARDPGSDVVPDEISSQLANLFHHTGEMLRAGGAEWRHVAKMNFYLPSLEHRAMLNVPWLERFPDPDARPARHTQVGSGNVAQCDFIAYVDD